MNFCKYSDDAMTFFYKKNKQVIAESVKLAMNDQPVFFLSLVQR